MTHHVTDENFEAEVLKSELPVMVDFYADWCGPCKMVAPTIDELATEYEGKVKIVKMNVDEAPNTPRTYNVMSIPTFIIFKNGEVVEQMIGAHGKDSYVEKLTSL